MADTKKGGNSIVWSWREVGVENCTCMSVAAGMYCGPERTPGIANDSPCGTSCGQHCWDLGYVDAATGYFISKGFPVCGGPDAPPTPDPIAWVEFPTLTDLNTDGVPPCQRRATSVAFMQQAGLQAELQDQIFESVGTDVQGEYSSNIDRLPIPLNLLGVAAGAGAILYSVGTGAGKECQCSKPLGTSRRTGKAMAIIANGCCKTATCWVLTIRTASGGSWGPSQGFSTCAQGTGLRTTSPQVFDGGDLNDLLEILCGGVIPCVWRPLMASAQA